MKVRARLLAALSAIASTLAVAATVHWSQRWNLVTSALVLAVGWAAVLAAIDALMIWHGPAVRPAVSDRRASVTAIVRLGEERPDIARTSITLAAQAGPVVVIATRHHELLDELGSVDIREHVAPTIVEALSDAARLISTDAVLVLSASAFPLGEACEAAAGQLADGVGWVIGTAPAFNNDRYAPGERELIAARVRAIGRDFGLVTWEPDATIVRTSLLREHALDPGRPYGTWLRARSSDGWRGITLAEPVAVRAAPADAPVFWPTQTKRRRGAVADLMDATMRGTLRARVVAVGALMRELYACPAALWLLAIVLIGRTGAFPLAVSPVTFFVMQGTLAGARWLSSRFAYGVGLHPVDEAREAAYDLPGSFLALPSALTRRVRPIRLTVPDQPMLWFALVLTLVTTIPLLDRRTPTGSAVGVAVGLAVAALAAMWVFALRAFGARRWDRASYRLAIDVPVTIVGSPARTVDASPAGLAIAGAPSALVRGSRVSASVEFEDVDPITVHGRVTDVRRMGERSAVGLALELGPVEQGAWVRALFAAAGVTRRVPVLPGSSVARPRFVFDRERASVRQRCAIGLQATVVGAVSVIVLGALLLALIGYRPMVVRSGSMEPTLGIGDVVVADWLRADRIRPGEIVTFPADIGRIELVTHRVQHVVISGGRVHVVTKGDANTEPEHWSVPRDTLVGHVVWRVPKVGRALVVLGESTTRWGLVGVSGSVVLIATLAAGLRGLRLRRRRRVSTVLSQPWC